MKKTYVCLVLTYFIILKYGVERKPLNGGGKLPRNNRSLLALDFLAAAVVIRKQLSNSFRVPSS